MDDDGLIPEALEEALVECRANGDRVKFLYTVPNFHNPAGVTLSEPRREAIMAIAEQYDLLIIEDNPYGLLGFEHEPMRALRARDAQRVIYLGSFSKTFSPGLRVGWVLAPLAVREKLVLATEAQVLCPPSLTQYAVARYLDTQPWREQIKIFTELYRERRDATLESLATLMPAGTTWTRPDGGFYVWLKLPHGLDAKLMQPRAVNAHVAYVPGIGFYADGSGREYMRLSYCYPEPDRIREGVRRLARVIEAELDLHSTFDAVDTGTFRAVPRPGPGTTAETIVGPGQQRHLRGRPMSETAPASPAHRPAAADATLRAVVLAGGLTFEREVSLSSGTQVVEELARAGLDAELRDADADLLPGLAAVARRRRLHRPARRHGGGRRPARGPGPGRRPLRRVARGGLPAGLGQAGREVRGPLRRG